MSRKKPFIKSLLALLLVAGVADAAAFTAGVGDAGSATAWLFGIALLILAGVNSRHPRSSRSNETP
ncbi:MAG: hypothetical protein V2J24_00780 [Pseudomonadales bacterium]|jgi:peptidoglycan/LPS O-acetylase OafA/YrhL|nr:hypothetical protein [Pseudomonadales bacterium]